MEWLAPGEGSAAYAESGEGLLEHLEQLPAASRLVVQGSNPLSVGGCFPGGVRRPGARYGPRIYRGRHGGAAEQRVLGTGAQPRAPAARARALGRNALGGRSTVALGLPARQGIGACRYLSNVAAPRDDGSAHAARAGRS